LQLFKEHMSNLLDLAKSTILLESEALNEMQNALNEHLVQLVERVISEDARLVVTGIGKSGIIAQKWVATFNSTGQRAVFMHAADAIHGDLGMIEKSDWVICISKSGESPEIRYLIPLILEMGNQLVAVTAQEESYLGKKAHFVLATPVKREACPNNLAPTTSTTLQLAMGDVLAVCLMEQRKFGSEDFARFHPGGALGKKLTRKVEDIMVKGNQLLVNLDNDFTQIVSAISSGRVGAIVVMDKDMVVGIITDGDVRRALEKRSDIQNIEAKNIMSLNPQMIQGGALAVEAFRKMEEKSITQLVVVNPQNQFLGVVHIHDLLREGIF
jgi:arabinose-5-phosphate isomerase